MQNFLFQHFQIKVVVQLDNKLDNKKKILFQKN